MSRLQACFDIIGKYRERELRKSEAGEAMVSQAPGVAKAMNPHFLSIVSTQFHRSCIKMSQAADRMIMGLGICCVQPGKD